MALEVFNRPPYIYDHIQGRFKAIARIMKYKKKISAELVEFKCKACDSGVYRHTGFISDKSHPLQYEHACSSCQNTVFFTMIYPVIEYKEKEFMLAESIQRFRGSVKPSIK